MTGSLPDGFAPVILGVANEKDLINVPGIFLRYLEQFVFAGGLVISDGCFVEMAHVVKLVAVHDEGIRFIAHHVPLRAYPRGVGGIKVTVRFLGGSDDVDDPVELGFQFRVVL